MSVAVAPVAVRADAAQIEQGRYLFSTRGCADCHGANGAGKTVIKDGPMLIVSPNITSGANSVTTAYKIEDWVRTVRHGDTSADALREKMRFVVELMEGRLKALGFSWSDALATQAYTVHDIGSLIGPEIAAHGAAPAGVTWHLARPPVHGLEFEMDVRGPARELLI